MSRSLKLLSLGQSIWYDSIKRSLIRDGTIKGMIERREILGMTSNPSIFEKAIKSDSDYEVDLKMMSWAGLSSEDIFYQLAIQDIQDAADLFMPYYIASNGADGFVSLEVNPKLAHDTQGTIEEAKWLWQEVNRPNVMIKIPATKNSLPAITEVIAEGINVTVTLVFSRKRYVEVMEAYTAGLEKRLQQGKDISTISSVCAFFVSRLDSKLELKLEEIIAANDERSEQAQKLMGKLAIGNIRLAYQDYLEFFSSPRFAALIEVGATPQRPLWASTGTKNPAYNDIMYVEEIIAENSINTMPPDTLTKFLDHGDPKISIFNHLEQAIEDFEKLEAVGINLDEVTQELEDDGVNMFIASYDSLIDAIEIKRNKYVLDLGDLAFPVSKTLKELNKQNTIGKIFRNDPSLWTSTPEGEQTVQTRLGWRDLPTLSLSYLAEINGFAEQCRKDGINKTLILGMGGSSLAPETMSSIIGGNNKDMELRILDSTVPEEVKELEKWVDYPKTLFIVASKSGTTSEPMAFYEYFKKQAERALGKEWSSHFVAITDPGSQLASLGDEMNFRAVFTADPNVGGRYSALTHFGLVPAALLGINITEFLQRAKLMADSCSLQDPLEKNQGALLGTIIGTGAKNGKDKLTIVCDKEVAPIGAWLEQLIAESSGKIGKGIVPIVDEPLLDANVYRKDRLFVYIRKTGEKDKFFDQLHHFGHSLIVLDMIDSYDLAAQFYLWEFAIAIACHIIGVNAFDQPDVQDSKDRTKKNLTSFLENGYLNEPDVIWQKDGVQVYGNKIQDLETCVSISNVIDLFTSNSKDGNYIAINAYLPRNHHTEVKLTELRKRILEKTGFATTLGFGPRFLHSTGQLHKGGADNGLFIQITQDVEDDLEIPDMGISFGVLAGAQAQGDLEALQARNKPAIRIHLTTKDTLDF